MQGDQSDDILETAVPGHFCFVFKWVRLVVNEKLMCHSLDGLIHGSRLNLATHFSWHRFS